jgi:hypothetical protein
MRELNFHEVEVISGGTPESDVGGALGLLGGTILGVAALGTGVGAVLIGGALLFAGTSLIIDSAFQEFTGTSLGSDFVNAV